MKTIQVTILLLILACSSAFAQITPTNQDQFRMLELPTANAYRSASGAPGTNYWQQRADYDIKVSLDGENHKITGSEIITYTNNSPEDLGFVWVTVEQNKFSLDSRGSIINTEQRWRGSFAEGGATIGKVQVEMDGEIYDAEYTIVDTQMRIDFKEVLKAGGSVAKLHIDWSFIIPEYGADRMGRLKVDKGWIYQLAQWYPRMYTFDDVNGWNVMSYLGQGEFYLEYGDYNLEITVPKDMIVVSTGELTNEAEVYPPAQQAKWAEARNSEETVMIVSKRDVKRGSARPKGPGPITWKFRAENVRDVSWAASEAFIIDAASWDGILMVSAYAEEGIGKGDARGEKAGWEHSTEYTLTSIKYYSEKWFRYPYPVATNVAGIVGGMEYPGIVFCSIEARGNGLWGVTDHEFGHEWFPMVVGNDERRHAWMDEGFNTFINFYSEDNYYKKPEGETAAGAPPFMARAMSGETADQPIYNYPDNIRRRGLGILAYYKPGYGLVLLREVILGHDRFDKALQVYIDRWKYKHPQPADFFRTMENVGGEDLDWFFRGWFFETRTIDQSIESVVRADNLNEIMLVNEGLVMPVSMRITFDDGSEEMRDLPVDIWRMGDRFPIQFDSEKSISKVELNANGWLPDVNPDNNVWEKAGE